MDRFEALIRAILWLWNRDWGRSVLLGFASIGALAALSSAIPMANSIFEGPVFRAGFYVGTVVMPRETIGGHSLFGLAANFLALIGLWFLALRLVHRFSADRPAKR